MSERGRPARRQTGNPRLRLAREARNWTQDDVAAALRQLSAELGEAEPGVIASRISEWECGRGRRFPSRFYQARLCVVLDATPQQLGFEPGPRLLEEIGNLARRRLERERARDAGGGPLRSVSPMATEDAFPQVVHERLSAALRYLWPVDVALMDGLERAGRRLDLRAELERPADVLPDLIAFLAAIQELLGRPQAVGVRLKSIGARIAHDIAYLHLLQGRKPAAFTNYAVSEALAREAGDDVELATTLVGKNAIYLPGDMTTAVQVTEAAAMLLDERAPSGLVAWVWGERAMQEAALGRETEARRFLGRALEVADRDPDGLNLFAPDMPPSWLERRPAVVALELGHAAEARGLLEATRPRIDPRFTREAILNGVELASALVMLGEVPTACELLGEAASLAAETGNRRSRGIAQEVRDRQLSRWRKEPAVRRLDELLRAV